MGIMGNSSNLTPDSPQDEAQRDADARFANSVIRGTWRQQNDDDDDED